MGPESARDQCSKEGCRGCPSCADQVRQEHTVTKKYVLQSLTPEEIRAELKRRRDLRRRMHQNAAVRSKIEVLQKEIDKLRKQIV